MEQYETRARRLAGPFVDDTRGDLWFSPCVLFVAGQSVHSVLCFDGSRDCQARHRYDYITMSSKRYTDTDAGAIIQRATELHAKAGDSTRLSLGDVEQIAKEMGVPVEHVHTAARELQAPEAAKRSGYWAIPAIRASADLEGPVDEERWATIVQILRRHLGGAGETETIGTTRYWNRTVYDMGSEISRSDASITPHPGGATIELSRTGVAIYRLLLQAAGAAVGGGFFALLLTVGDVGPLVGILGVLSGAAVGVAGTRRALIGWTKRQVRRLSELAAHIVEATAPQERPPESLLDSEDASIELMDGTEEESSAGATRQRTRG